MNNDKDNDNYAQSLLDEFEQDAQDTITAELEAMLMKTLDDHTSKGGHLTLMLQHSEGDFPVSSISRYCEPVWRFQGHNCSDACSLYFNSKTEGANDLKKALSFYLLPENANLIGIKSYTSTVKYSNNFAILEKYLLIDNHLMVSPQTLAMISAKTINEALDRARDYESASNYFNFFYILRHWLSLSEHELIPEGLRVHVSISKVVNPERSADIRERMRGALQPWVPFSEEDLSHMMEYAFFWIEKAAPELSKIESVIDKVNRDNKQGKIHRSRPDLELEAMFKVQVNGKIIMQVTRHSAATPLRPEYWRYMWKSDWAQALEHVRNAVFIMIALVTGARSSELAPLSITDISNDRPDGSGDYWIRIVRWKTAADPIYNGEVEYLPLPKFVAESTIAYDKLRNIGRKINRHWLFQSNKVGSANEIKKVTPQLLTALIRQLKEVLPIERLHVHRFRKTIAEILINQDERNIDLIRALFGHKTFTMTMRYIARNPAMVRSVALSLEQSYTHELQEIIQAIRVGAYSGQAALRISEQISIKPDDFQGKKIQLSLFEYVTNLLMGGRPLFIKRTAIGTYCVTAEHFNLDNLPPCIEGRDFGDDLPRPDPTNCHYDCRKIVVLEKAKTALEENVKFYQRILNNPKAMLPDATRYEIQAKIESYQYHLTNLSYSNMHRYNPDFADQAATQSPDHNLISGVFLYD